MPSTNVLLQDIINILNANTLVNQGILKDILTELEAQGVTLQQILAAIEGTELATSLKISFGGSMANTVTMTVGQSVQATAHEFNGTVELPITNPISWTSSDVTIATVDPTSGLVKAVGAGQATITATDSVLSLTGQGIVSDTAVVATSLTVDFGTPV